MKSKNETNTPNLDPKRLELMKEELDMDDEMNEEEEKEVRD